MKLVEARGQTEVRQLDVTTAVQQNVVRLDVTNDESEISVRTIDSASSNAVGQPTDE
jgi:hypothetical protein